MDVAMFRRHHHVKDWTGITYCGRYRDLKSGSEPFDLNLHCLRCLYGMQKRIGEKGMLTAGYVIVRRHRTNRRGAGHYYLEERKPT